MGPIEQKYAGCRNQTARRTKTMAAGGVTTMYMVQHADELKRIKDGRAQSERKHEASNWTSGIRGFNVPETSQSRKEIYVRTSSGSIIVGDSNDEQMILCQGRRPCEL